MSENTKWTNEQSEAITEKGCNLLVAAAAGAGKTAVLVERIIRKITAEKDPVDIDKLLVVTFTNAAATEMRERIAEAISTVLEKNPGSKNIQRQLTLLNKASITTIHSFCLEVIRSNFQSINIDPGFRITDETEASLMKLEVLNELFEAQYEKENGNEDFFELLECYGGNRDDQVLQDMVLSLYSFIQSSPWPQKWLDEMTEGFNLQEGIDFGQTPWGGVLLSTVTLELEGLKEMLERAAGILNSAPGLEKYQAVYIEDIASINSLQKIVQANMSSAWDSLYKALQSLEFSRLPNAGKDADKGKQEYVKKIRDDVKASIKKIKERLFTADSREILHDLKTVYPMMKCLSRLVSQFSENYAAMKSKKSVADFNDLEHFCLDILSEQDENGVLAASRTALGYRERFVEILVDEYQDSNMVQEIMIKMISKTDAGEPNVFMVGDVKQSIYRFRQAKPELFLGKYNSYSMGKGSLFRKILLFRNFRSRREVVDAVNFIFKQIMSVSVGELDYTDTEALYPGAAFLQNDKETETVGGEVELHLIQTGGNDESSHENEENGEDNTEASPLTGDPEEKPEDTEMLDSIQCEARLVAQRIAEIMQPDGQGRVFSVFDKGRNEYRKAEYRDIVILLRTTRNWSDVFMEELAQAGIPAFADTGTGFFKTSEVQVVLSLLQIIDNPLQDIPLLSVLRSPIASFTTDELAQLRLANRKASLYDALQALAVSGQSQASKKASDFLACLYNWRDISLYMSTDQLLWQLYNETGYYGMVGAMPAGEQRQANLRILFERARQFEETSYKGLFNFINFVDKLKSSKGDMGSAKILGENDNVVRIMSIHKSKGLEFPVVILSGCGKKFNLQDMNKSILLHQELGFGPDIVDYKLRLSYPSIPKQAIREKIKVETLSEEMRILYVALTRAREKLIITGAVSDIGKAAAKWAQCANTNEEKLPAYEILKGCRYLDWIGPALMRHKDCSSLRENAGAGNEPEGFINDTSIWNISMWDKNDVLSSKTAEDQDENGLNSLTGCMDTDGDTCRYKQEIERRLCWSYQFEKASRVPAKVSVTELKRRFDAELTEQIGELPDRLPALVTKPMFLQEKKGLSSAEAGTALHFVMQHLDYEDLDYEAQIEKMITKDLLTKQQAESVDLDKIRRFFKSPLGKRLLASKVVNREIPFNIEIPCYEVYSDMADKLYCDETMLLQGVMDCFFEEPDGFVLLDYKTDYVPAGKTESLRERYRLQISYYARALEKLTGRKVKGKYIYLFWNGEVLEY